MGHWIDPSLWNHWAISRSSQCSTTDVINAMVWCCPVCGKVLIKEPLLLIKKQSPCSSSIVPPLSLSEWSFTVCPTPYDRKYNVLSVLLNKTFRSFLVKIQSCWVMSVCSLLVLANSSWDGMVDSVYTCHSVCSIGPPQVHIKYMTPSDVYLIYDPLRCIFNVWPTQMYI